MPVCGDFERRRQHSATTVHRALPVSEWANLGIPWATARSSSASIVCSRFAGAFTGAAAGLGRLFVGVAVLPVSCGNFQWRRQHSASTAQAALLVSEWPAVGMPWDTARSNAASAVRSRCGRACTGGCGRAGQMVCGGCSFAV